MSSKTSSRANRRSTRGEYIETDTGNKISRRARIEGTSHIILAGRVVVQAEACLRGDLARLPAPTTKGNDPSSSSSTNDPKSSSISTPASRTSITIGRYTLVSHSSTLHPPHRLVPPSNTLSYYPMKVGENVYIGPRAFVSAASIGNHVHIGADAVVENGVVIRDNVKVLEGAVVCAGMVVPSGVLVGGVPGRVLGEVGEGWGVMPAGGGGGGGGGGRMGEGAKWVEGGELRELIRSIK